MKRDLLLKDYKKAEDARLQEAVGWCDELIQELTDQIAQTERKKENYQAELHRRALDRYWVAHPEHQPIQVGDALASNVLWDTDPVPTRQEVSQIDLEAETATVRYWKYNESNPRYYPDLPLVVVCDGRRVYLQQEKFKNDVKLFLKKR